MGFYFLDYLTREAKSDAGIDSLTANSYAVRSTINPALQRAAEVALQEGLARFELNSGRMQFQGPEANLADAVQRLASEQASQQAASGSSPVAPTPPSPPAAAAPSGPMSGARPQQPPAAPSKLSLIHI